MNFSSLKNRYKCMSVTMKASLWYTFCNVISKGLALLTTPVFTRLLTEDDYGTFALFQSWKAIILIFTSLNIFMAGYSKGLLLYKGKEDEYTTSSLIQTTFITLLFLFVYLLGIKWWTRLLDIEPHLVVAMFFELLLMPAFEFWSSRKRFEYKYSQFVCVTLSMSILSLLSGVLAVILSKYKLEARVYTDVGSKLIFAGVIYILLLSKNRCFFSKEYWMYNFRFNVPLLPHYLSNYALNQLDRLMIGKMVGKAEVGYYSVAYSISMMMNLVTLAINNALTPFIYQSIDKEAVKSIKNKTSPIFFLIAGMCVLTMAFAPEIILIFGGKEYMDAVYVIPPIAASVFFIFVYAMFSTVEYYYQKTGWIAIATTVSACLNAILNLIFIKLFGYYAAGYTTLICYICLALAHYILYKKVIKENFSGIDSFYDEKNIFITSIVVILSMLLMIACYSSFVIRYSIVLLIVLIVIVKRDMIKGILLNLKK